jgi:Flp pilus assembly protein TadG
MTTGTKKAPERGNAILESALVFNLFIVIVLAVIEFGFAVYAFNFVSYAAREGTRYASVRGANSGHPAQASDVSSYVAGEAIALNSSKLTVTTTWSPDNNPGSIVKVTVSYTYVPLLSLIVPNSFKITSTSQMVISQ